MKEDRPVIYEQLPFTRERFFQTYKRLAQNEAQHVLLESGRTGKYSIAGLKPFAVLTAGRQTVQVEKDATVETLHGDPLLIMEKWMDAYTFPPQPGLPEFQGGAIGYISYDYVECLEEMPQLAVDDLNFPLLHFLMFDEWAIFDHDENILWLMALNGKGAELKLHAAKKAWLEDSESRTGTEPLRKPYISGEENISLTLSEREFEDAVEQIKSYIAEGEVCQVNLTVRQSQKMSVTPMDVYEELRQLNPSPYMGYIHTPEFQIISGSPELLINKDGSRVGTRPIGGTRPRGIDEEEDRKLEEDLSTNGKDAAEHVMLVDIERNDLSKVCAYGTVRTDEFMVIEKYSHVMHIVSQVNGELADGNHAYDFIRAVFPGGSITGAPKVRTMEIIEELEPVKRGVYTGSIGWIGFNGDLRLNVVIRTMLVKDGMCHVQAGAGIVIDSDGKEEYAESLKKAEALWRAKEVAEQRRVLA